MADTTVCGTYAGYQRHKYRGELICNPCRDANAAYRRDRRARKPHSDDESVTRQYARDRALRRLGRMYPDVLAGLVTEELARVTSQHLDAIQAARSAS